MSISYYICEILKDIFNKKIEKRRGERGRRIKTMKRPKAPPSVKPIAPEIAVLLEQDFIITYIYKYRA